MKKYVLIDPDGTANVGLCLVIEQETGVEYGHQCGGVATEIKSIEGFLIPLGMKDIEQDIAKFFWKEFKENCHNPNNAWPVDQIEKLSKLISKIPDWQCDKIENDKKAFLKLDVERIDDCVEAWIPILSVHGRGMLLFRNSD